MEHRCILTGDRLFPSHAPCAVVEDGLLFCVQGSVEVGVHQSSMDGPMASLASNLSGVDVVTWAGLRRVQLDRAGFIKQWRRYLSAVERVLQQTADGEARAQRLTLQGFLFARNVLQRFDQCDFWLGASEDLRGGVVVMLHDDLAPLTPLLFFVAEGCTTAPAPFTAA
jgi:hypothetical protein